MRTGLWRALARGRGADCMYRARSPGSRPRGDGRRASGLVCRTRPRLVSHFGRGATAGSGRRAGSGSWRGHGSSAPVAGSRRPRGRRAGAGPRSGRRCRPFATQLARWRGAYAIATASPDTFDAARALGAHEVVDGRRELDKGIGPVDLVFDTDGGELLERATALLGRGGRRVSVAEEPPGQGTYFVVEPAREQLMRLRASWTAASFGSRSTRPSRSRRRPPRQAQPRSGKHGKVVIRVAGQSAFGAAGGR
jgi:hypothetical protein